MPTLCPNVRRALPLAARGSANDPSFMYQSFHGFFRVGLLFAHARSRLSAGTAAGRTAAAAFCAAPEAAADALASAKVFYNIPDT